MARPRDPASKDALVSAARKELAKKGLLAARVEDITAACGLSKGAFYLHYPSKEALFGELVQAFRDVMAREAQERKRARDEFRAAHGIVTRSDVIHRTKRYADLIDLAAAQDLVRLEHLWAHRDILQVLLRGSQGTPFEGVIWTLTFSEVDRVQKEYGALQKAACARDDLPPEVIGSLLVGTYLLLALKMSRMKKKPDLARWARSLHTLIREGAAPEDRHSNEAHRA